MLILEMLIFEMLIFIESKCHESFHVIDI